MLIFSFELFCLAAIGNASVVGAAALKHQQRLGLEHQQGRKFSVLK
jgi:hypothetical protein